MTKSKPEINQKLKNCPDCSSKLASGVKKCKYCGSYQGFWMRKFSITQSILSLLVAFFAVLTLFVSNIELDKTDIQVEISGFEEMLPIFLVSNNGNKSGLIKGIELTTLKGAQPDSVTMRWFLDYDDDYLTIKPYDIKYIRPSHDNFEHMIWRLFESNGKRFKEDYNWIFIFELRYYNLGTTFQRKVFTGRELNKVLEKEYIERKKLK